MEEPYVPMQRIHYERQDEEFSREYVNVGQTAWARLLAAAPGVWLVFCLILIANGLLTWSIVVTLLMLGKAVDLLLAELDRLKLLTHGLDNPPSAFWAIPLSGVYLAIRGNMLFNLQFRGLEPLWAHLAILLGSACLFVLFTLWSGALRSLGY